MRLIDADKLHIDKQINGECWINQEQIINAPTVEAVPLSVIEKIHDAIDDMECEDLTFYDGVNKLGNAEYVCRDEVHEIVDKAVKECTHE